MEAKIVNIESINYAIERMNALIRLHQSAEQPDVVALMQYKELKERAIFDLLDDLADLDIAETVQEYYSLQEAA